MNPDREHQVDARRLFRWIINRRRYIDRLRIAIVIAVGSPVLGIITANDMAVVTMMMPAVMPMMSSTGCYHEAVILISESPESFEHCERILEEFETSPVHGNVGRINVLRVGIGTIIHDISVLFELTLIAKYAFK